MGNALLIGQNQNAFSSSIPDNRLTTSSFSEKNSINLSMSCSADNTDSTERIKSDSDQQFRETLHFLNPQFIQAAHRLMDEPIERRAFMSFLENDLWLDYMDMKLCSALIDASNAFMREKSSVNVHTLSDQAKEVYLDELDMDNTLNADRVRIENCFSSRELRYLTICIILSAYLKYCSCSDTRPPPPTPTLFPLPPSSSPQPNHLTPPSDTSSQFSSAPQHHSSNENNTDLIDLPPDSMFFLSPIDLMQRIKYSTSSREFTRILSTGTWLTEVCMLVDRLALALCLHRANQSSEHKGADHGVVYGNHEYVASFSSKSPLPASSHSLFPSKTRIQYSIRTSTSIAMHQSVLVSTLPLDVSPGQYTLCMHHSITRSTANQRILLRLSDFILLVVGSMLE
ncbi:hypothetical protein EON63_00445 [archaeon]|nr:MAG: hypothetical protein EON63_00445 [archaeon]